MQSFEDQASYYTQQTPTAVAAAVLPASGYSTATQATGYGLATATSSFATADKYPVAKNTYYQTPTAAGDTASVSAYRSTR